MGHLLQVLEKEQEMKTAELKGFPDFGPGDVLEVKLEVPENRRREAVFKGLCISKRRRGWRTVFTLRNHIANAGPIERTFPLYSPIIQSLKLIEHRKVRRAKLYYLRNANPREYKA
ncbi:hypothetical protein WJX73_003544 [Symbiochloris irregularis]|uniref:50S ribosomal protein L19 n=1 Tax=Symbiochloris irregularis TaxID=706552 RepID=A0AAW1PLP6_9CHLO